MEPESEDLLSNLDKRVIERLESIEDIPTIPLVISKIEQAVDSPSSTVKDVAAIIEDDPSIMARVLKVVNSVFYRPPGSREVSSLSLAVARLGFRTIKNIALTTSVFSLFGKRRFRSFDLDKFWEHCITTGIISNIIYDVCGGNLRRTYSRDELHLVGLLHDLGKIILEQYFHGDFVLALEASDQKNQHIAVSEREILGTDHAEVGGWLAHKWALPSSAVSAILHHHQPTESREEHRDLVAVTHLADFVCLKGAFGYSGSKALPKFERAVWKYLQLNNAIVTEIIDRTREEAKHSRLLLSIMSSD